MDGAALLGQLLSEQCDDLRREGFQIQSPVFDRDFDLYLRTEDAVRVFDNLFSNLRKYADAAAPVLISWQDGPETVTLRVENQAKAAPDQGDSHGLGVPTMKELMERSGGTLETSREDGVYRSALIFRKRRGCGAV
ncbi:MAG: ATP-binding protein [Oscillospiraceae bacterium]|nr:ATP-binding protein [Oscillospiraceae bacterium]